MKTHFENKDSHEEDANDVNECENEADHTQDGRLDWHGTRVDEGVCVARQQQTCRCRDISLKSRKPIQHTTVYKNKLITTADITSQLKLNNEY